VRSLIIFFLCHSPTLLIFLESSIHKFQHPSFELALLARTHSTIHAFDPSVWALPSGEQVISRSGVPGMIVFHRKGLLGASMNFEDGWGPLETLEDLISSIGLAQEDRIDLLKIDCEGSVRETSCICLALICFDVY
jgi:hypothetical protein